MSTSATYWIRQVATRGIADQGRKILRREELKILFAQVLNERESAVLELRFGLDGQGERTLDQVGNIFQVTRERIRQI